MKIEEKESSFNENWALGVLYSLKNIFLHGLGQTKESWDRVIEGDENARAIDLYKHLKEGECDFETLERGVFESLDREESEFNLCGLSLGGVLALKYAANHPESVKKLILIGTPIYIPRLIMSFQMLIFRLLKEETFESLGLSKASFISLAKSLKNIHLGDRLQKIQAPSLVLVGEKDKMMHKQARKMAADISHADFAFIPGAGHVVNTDQPEALRAEVYRFLGKV